MSLIKWLWRGFCNLPMPWYPLLMIIGLLIYLSVTK